jgi:Serine/threonine protein phosphatase
MEFIISGTTDIGTKKKINQDSLFVRKMATKTGEMVLAVLCDGMGGLKKGELASASIVDAFTDWMYICLPELSQKSLEDYVIREQWTAIIAEQNEKIRAYGQQKGCHIGSTVTVLLLTKERYFLLAVGDSRAYEIDNEIKQLTVDHTVMEREIERGNITIEQARDIPIRGVLTKCVGVANEVYPDMFFGDTKTNAMYMLCSDGFCHQIDAEEIENVMKREPKGSGMKNKEVFLVELNKQRGETDNISVITIVTK